MDFFISDDRFRHMLIIRPGSIRRTSLPSAYRRLPLVTLLPRVTRLPGGTRLSNSTGLPGGARKGLRASGTHQLADTVQLRVQCERPDHLRRQEPS